MKKKLLLVSLILALSTSTLAIAPMPINKEQIVSVQQFLSKADIRTKINLSFPKNHLGFYMLKDSFYQSYYPLFEILQEKSKKAAFYKEFPEFEKYQNIELMENNEYPYTGNVPVPEENETMKRIVSTANIAGELFNVDVNLILALIFNESTFNPNAISSANCRGLMQISYKYAPSFDMDQSRLYEIEYNILEGTRLLTTYSVSEMGNFYNGLRAYNQGVSAAKANSSNGAGYANKILSTYKTYKANGFYF